MKKYKFKIYALWGVGNQFEEQQKFDIIKEKI